jgi:hypothetical protein
LAAENLVAFSEKHDVHRQRPGDRTDGLQRGQPRNIRAFGHQRTASVHDGRKFAARLDRGLERRVRPCRSVTDRPHVVHIVVDDRERRASVVIRPDTGKRLGLDELDFRAAQFAIVFGHQFRALTHARSITHADAGLAHVLREPRDTLVQVVVDVMIDRSEVQTSQAPAEEPSRRPR